MAAADWIRERVGPDVIVPRLEDCYRARGMVVGSIRVRGSASESHSRWWDGVRIAWDLWDPHPCRPVEARGNLGLWRATPELMERLRDARRGWMADRRAGRA